MKFKLLMTAKNSVFTISVILLLLNVFTSCSKDEDRLVDKQFTNTVWICRYPVPYHNVYAEAYVFFRDGTVEDYGLDSHDKILYHYATFSFSRIDATHISFSEKMSPILVDGDHFTFFGVDFDKSSYRPEDLA